MGPMGVMCVSWDSMHEGDEGFVNSGTGTWESKINSF